MAHIAPSLTGTSKSSRVPTILQRGAADGIIDGMIIEAKFCSYKCHLSNFTGKRWRETWCLQFQLTCRVGSKCGQSCLLWAMTGLVRYGRGVGDVHVSYQKMTRAIRPCFACCAPTDTGFNHVPTSPRVRVQYGHRKPVTCCFSETLPKMTRRSATIHLLRASFSPV